MFAKIVGTGSCMPEKVLTNDDLSELIDTTDEWITKRVGIKRRHIVAGDDSLMSMSLIAAKQALAAANLAAADIDMIIVGTVTADYVFPSAACLLQQALGVKNGCPAFDVNAACSGFLYAMNVTKSFIASGAVKNVLVVGADAASKLMDWTDRSTCVLFGDGAGAIVMQASEEPGILAAEFGANGDYTEKLFVRNSIWQDNVAQYIEMEGKEVFRYATNKMTQLVLDLVDQSKVAVDDIDWFIPHQANKRITEALIKKLGVDSEKIIQTIEEHGNTSSASVPLALDFAVRSGKIKSGDTVFLEAFGGGFTWGGVLLKY